jgi:hypothetical protein
MMMTDQWNSNQYLDPSLREDCSAALDEVTDQLVAYVRRGDTAGAVADSELALFFHYAQDRRGGRLPCSLVASVAERAADGAASTPLRPALHGGLLQIAWTLHHLHESGRYRSEPLPEASTDVDDLLADSVSAPKWDEEWDLISGLSGFAVFALSRLAVAPTQSRHTLTRVVRLLDDLAVSTPEGVMWLTPAGRVPPRLQKEWSSGYFNLGAAHGSPAPLTVLAHCAARGIEAARATPLAERAAQALVAHVTESDSAVTTCTWKSGEHVEGPARHAWCYGVPGMAVALGAFGLLSQRRDYVDTARRWAEKASDDVERSGVRDPSLCHGSAGLAHVYARLGFSLSSRRLLESAATWHRRSLEARRPAEGIGGFFCLNGEPLAWTSEPGFLTGVTGIGLVLASAVSREPPRWDTLLACLLEQATCEMA